MKAVLHAGDEPEALDREKNLNAVSWGLFFLWVGVAWLAGVGWAIGLLVTGLLVLGAQTARKFFELPIEGFWVGVGVLFALGGIWQSFNVQVGLIPIVFLLAGIALLTSTFTHRHAH